MSSYLKKHPQVQWQLGTKVFSCLMVSVEIKRQVDHNALGILDAEA